MTAHAQQQEVCARPGVPESLHQLGPAGKAISKAGGSKKLVSCFPPLITMAAYKPRTAPVKAITGAASAQPTQGNSQQLDNTQAAAPAPKLASSKPFKGALSTRAAAGDTPSNKADPKTTKKAKQASARAQAKGSKAEGDGPPPAKRARTTSGGSSRRRSLVPVKPDTLLQRLIDWRAVRAKSAHVGPSQLLSTQVLRDVAVLQPLSFLQLQQSLHYVPAPRLQSVCHELLDIVKGWVYQQAHGSSAATTPPALTGLPALTISTSKQPPTTIALEGPLSSGQSCSSTCGELPAVTDTTSPPAAPDHPTLNPPGAVQQGRGSAKACAATRAGSSSVLGKRQAPDFDIAAFLAIRPASSVSQEVQVEVPQEEEEGAVKAPQATGSSSGDSPDDTQVTAAVAGDEPSGGVGDEEGEPQGGVQCGSTPTSQPSPATAAAEPHPFDVDAFFAALPPPPVVQPADVDMSPASSDEQQDSDVAGSGGSGGGRRGSRGGGSGSRARGSAGGSMVHPWGLAPSEVQLLARRYNQMQASSGESSGSSSKAAGKAGGQQQPVAPYKPTRELFKFTPREDMWVMQQAMAKTDLLSTAAALRRTPRCVKQRLRSIVLPYTHVKTSGLPEHVDTSQLAAAAAQGATGGSLDLRDILQEALHKVRVPENPRLPGWLSKNKKGGAAGRAGKAGPSKATSAQQSQAASRLHGGGQGSRLGGADAIEGTSAAGSGGVPALQGGAGGVGAAQALHRSTPGGGTSPGGGQSGTARQHLSAVLQSLCSGSSIRMRKGLQLTLAPTPEEPSRLSCAELLGLLLEAGLSLAQIDQAMGVVLAGQAGDKSGPSPQASAAPACPSPSNSATVTAAGCSAPGVPCDDSTRERSNEATAPAASVKVAQSSGAAEAGAPAAQQCVPEKVLVPAAGAGGAAGAGAVPAAAAAGAAAGAAAAAAAGAAAAAAGAAAAAAAGAAAAAAGSVVEPAAGHAALVSLVTAALPRWEVHRVMACKQLPAGLQRALAVLQCGGGRGSAVTEAAVRAAYKRLSLMLHPDKHMPTQGQLPNPSLQSVPSKAVSIEAPTGSGQGTTKADTGNGNSSGGSARAMDQSGGLLLGAPVQAEAVSAFQLLRESKDVLLEWVARVAGQQQQQQPGQYTMPTAAAAVPR